MDTSGSILYRLLELNDTTITSRRLDGIQTLRADLSDIEVVQYTEKKALAEGDDAEDVFLGKRTLTMNGNIFGLTRASFYDRVRAFRRVMNAKSAFLDDPENEGYLPMYFSMPTADTVSYPGGVIELKMFLLPAALRIVYARNKLGGRPSDALSVPWAARLTGRDPFLYAASDTSVSLPAGLTAWTNRGDVPAVVNLDLVVGAAAGSVDMTVGGTILSIDIPSGSAGRAVSYRGDSKLVRIEGALAMGSFSVTPDAHPLVPLGPSDVEVAATGATITSGSVYFTETYT